MYKNELQLFQQKRSITKTKKRKCYSKEKATEYYLQNKEATL